MSNMLNEIVTLLRAIKETLTPIRFRKQEPPLDRRRLWSKQEVLTRLKMSEATYNRNLKKGLLVPMRLNGADMYFEEDILLALEESRRKGRI